MDYVIIDGRLLSGNNSGISRYTEQLIRSYIREYGYENVKVLVDNDYQSVDKFQYIRTGLKPFNFFHFFLFSKLLRSLNCQTLHSPFYVNCFNKPDGVRIIMTVHDLMYTIVDRFFSGNAILNLACVAYFNFLVKTSIKNSDEIVAVSKTTAEDVFRTFGRESIVSYEGVNYLEQKSIASISDDNILTGLAKDSFFLYAGNLRRHKNIEFLLRCFKKANSSRKLVIVGSYSPLKYQCSDNIIFTGFAPDVTLRQLYHNCSAFIYPSLYEGFGLPVLEALSMGAKVFCSNGGALKEFPTSVVYFFNPKVETELISLIENTDSLHFDSLEAAQILKKYRWEELLNEMHIRLREKMELKK